MNKRLIYSYSRRVSDVYRAGSVDGVFRRIVGDQLAASDLQCLVYRNEWI